MVTCAIVLGIFSPGLGRLSDSFGRKWPIVGLNLCGLVGCSVIASSKSIETAIAGSTIFGFSYLQISLIFAIPSVRFLAFSGLAVGGLLLISSRPPLQQELISRKHRPIVQAAVGVTSVMGVALGQLGGAAITEASTTTASSNSGSWRNFFWMIAAGELLVAILFAALYNPHRRSVIASRTASWDLVSYVPLRQAHAFLLIHFASPARERSLLYRIFSVCGRLDLWRR